MFNGQRINVELIFIMIDTSSDNKFDKDTVNHSFGKN